MLMATNASVLTTGMQQNQPFFCVARTFGNMLHYSNVLMLYAAAVPVLSRSLKIMAISKITSIDIPVVASLLLFTAVKMVTVTSL